MNSLKRIRNQDAPRESAPRAMSAGEAVSRDGQEVLIRDRLLRLFDVAPLSGDSASGL